MAKQHHKIGILIHDGAWISLAYPALDVYQTANLRQNDHFFDCSLVSPGWEPVRLFCGRDFQADYCLANAPDYDIILLCHYWGDSRVLRQQFPDIAPWLRAAHQRGALIAGVSSGILWAAEAGILDGRRATTHWRFVEEFKATYPDVNWVQLQSLVEDGGVYSVTGGSAGMDLSMHLIEQIAGETVARGMARDLTFDSRRNYDLTLFNIAGLRHHRDAGVHRAQDWLDEHYSENFSFSELAAQIGMSQRSFIRRFKAATGERPSRYLQRLRVESAKQQLINTDNSIKTICLNVGYQDFNYFGRVFRELAGASPRDFRKQQRPKIPADV